MISQHHMVVSTFKAGEEQTRKRAVENKVEIWKLKEDNITEYRAKVKEKRQTFYGKTGNEKWATTKDMILKAVEEVVVKHQVRETWRCDDEVQDVIKGKRDTF